MPSFRDLKAQARAREPPPGQASLLPARFMPGAEPPPDHTFYDPSGVYAYTGAGSAAASPVNDRSRARSSRSKVRNRSKMGGAAASVMGGGGPSSGGGGGGDSFDDASSIGESVGAGENDTFAESEGADGGGPGRQKAPRALSQARTRRQRMRKRLYEGGGAGGPEVGKTPFGLAIGAGTGTVGEVYVSLRPERGGGGAIRTSAKSRSGDGGGVGGDEGGPGEDDDASVTSFTSYKLDMGDAGEADGFADDSGGRQNSYPDKLQKKFSTYPPVPSSRFGLTKRVAERPEQASASQLRALFHHRDGAVQGGAHGGKKVMPGRKLVSAASQYRQRHARTPLSAVPKQKPLYRGDPGQLPLQLAPGEASISTSTITRPVSQFSNVGQNIQTPAAGVNAPSLRTCTHPSPLATTHKDDRCPLRIPRGFDWHGRRDWRAGSRLHHGASNQRGADCRASRMCWCRWGWALWRATGGFV